MTRPKISIFIPTYNRADFLDYLLNKFSSEWIFPFQIEIYIADNASNDNTVDVVERYMDAGLPIKYFRHDDVISLAYNFDWGRRHSSGEYVMYLADDDLIVPEVIASVIRYLDVNPGIVACFSPCVDYDDVHGQPLGQSYTLDDNIIARKSEFLAFFEVLVRTGVRPEAGIWRADAISHVGPLRVFSFAPYADLADMLLIGDVLFVREAFYRLVVRSKLAPTLTHAGVGVAKSGWDQEKGGFEELFTVITDRCGIEVSGDMRKKLGRMIDLAVVARQVCALGLWCDLKEYIRAYELYVRIRLTLLRLSIDEKDFQNLDIIKNIMRHRVPLRVAIELARVQRIRKVMLIGSCISSAEALRDAGLPDVIEIKRVMNWDELETPSRANLIIAENADQRMRVIGQGYPAGMVLDLAYLKERYAII
jgi:glycosyltransferase involved in cell wall biosynthesis